MNAGRREEDESILSYGHRLVSGELVMLHIRIVAVIYGVAYAIWGGSLIFSPDAIAYTNPVFRGIFTAAEPEVWGLAFWLASCAMFATAVSARAIVYLIAVALAAGVLAGWSIGVVAQWVIDDEAILTGGAFALYIMAFTGLGATVTSKRTIEHEVSIMERTPDGKVVPLVEADRRVG